MKVEIAESLVLSWLRHVQGCVVVQTSWKPSPTWPLARERELSEAFDALRGATSAPVFRNGDFRQLIRQTEIDVLGLRMPEDGGAPGVIAVEVAFHEAGVNYGGAEETVGRVLKKLVRAAFALEAYLDAGDATVVFATPKMAEPLRAGIEQHLRGLGSMLADQAALSMHRVRFRVIANRDFADEILRPVVEQADAVADTSELFMRAQQLLNLCEAPPREPRADRRACAEDGEAIGKHVRKTMRELAAANRLGPTDVARLVDRHYCKATFDLGLPFLKALDPAVDRSRQRLDGNGHGRYWKDPLRIGDHDFYLCCEWKEPQRPAFERWVRDLLRRHLPTPP